MKHRLLIPLILLLTFAPVRTVAQRISGGSHGLDHPKTVFRPQPLFKADTVTVVIIGDVMMHERQLSYDFTKFFEPIRKRLEAADIAVANMEFTLAGEPYSGYPAFSAPDGYAGYLRDCGVDIFLTANNHILDKGSSGLSRTLSVYKGMDGVTFTGTGSDTDDFRQRNPLFISRKGFRLAFVNFTYGTNVEANSDIARVFMMDRSRVSKAMEAADRADFTVVLPHWGEEYSLCHNGEQEDWAEYLADKGADAIVGAHPHVVQDSAAVGGSRVFYSIGNAVSNMSAENTRLELMVTLRFVREPSGECRQIQPSVDFLWCTLPGTLTDGYAVIAVKDYIGKRNLWLNPGDYDNMTATYKRVKAETGIKD